MTILTATEIAQDLDTTGREVRKFLRSITPKADQPGKGARWGIEKKEMRSIRPKFAKWVAAQEAAKAARQEANEAAPEVTDNAPLAEAEVEVEAEGPTHEELMQIELEG